MSANGSHTASAHAPRPRARGAGAKDKLTPADRVLLTVLYLRKLGTRDLFAEFFGIDGSTLTRAVHQVQPLLAEHGHTIAHAAAVRDCVRAALAGSTQQPPGVSFNEFISINTLVSALIVRQRNLTARAVLKVIGEAEQDLSRRGVKLTQVR